MATLLLYLGLMMVGAVVAMGIAAWASRGSAVRRNLVGLLLAAVASYAAGFLIDMLGAAFAGEIPMVNIIAPAFTWLAVTAAATLAALTTSAAPVALASPFAINAAIALAASAVRPRHIAAGILLAFFATLVLIVRRRPQAPSRSSGGSGGRAAA